MRVRFALLPSLCLVVASAAFADYGTPPPPPAPTPSTSVPASGSSEDAVASARHEAERYFADAYDDVVKAGKDAEKGKQDSATKRYRRALERSRSAVQLDSTYHEAWNLIGFTSRKLGDYPNSFSAYRVALRLKPDFGLAHEYYGEGLLETGDLAGAREQLAALRTCGPTELVAELEGAITKYVAAHPESAGSSPTPAAASPTPAAASATPVPQAPAPAVADTLKTGGGESR